MSSPKILNDSRLYSSINVILYFIEYKCNNYKRSRTHLPFPNSSPFPLPTRLCVSPKHPHPPHRQPHKE